jgi:putative transcriptional regulator
MPGAVALSVFLLAAPVQTTSEPEPGIFLVAKPSIEGGPFWHSVVLLLRHGKDGTVGLIVNRTTEIPLAEALPDLKSKDAGAHQLYFGGPVALDGLMFLFRSETSREKANRVMDHVQFSGDKELLGLLLDEKLSASELHLYLGHAGWGAGQLANEIERGDWELVQADAFSVFQSNPETLWDELTSNDTTVVASRARSLDPARLEPASKGELAASTSVYGPPKGHLGHDERDVVVERPLQTEVVESSEQRAFDLLCRQVRARFQQGL